MAGYPSGKRFYSKIRIAPGAGGRRTYQLAAGLDQAGADLRDALLDDLARAMVGAGLDAVRVIDPLLVKIAAAEGAEVERLDRYVRTRLLAGKRRSIEEAPTLRQFGAWWTSGELARRYPEQVEARKSARKDAQDLEKHVYPAIGDLLVSAVRIEHLEQVLRVELHEGGPGSKPFAFHGLRRTFVTLSLGAGRTEDWVMRRTGHTTSAQLHRYRIAAATAAEFGLGWLRDFDQVLAETADSLGAGNGPLSVKNTAKEAVAGGRLPTPGRETSPDTSPFSSEKDTSEEAEEGPQAHRGQGADRLSELIAAAIAEARSLGLVQVEIRLRNALTASSKRRAS